MPEIHDTTTKDQIERCEVAVAEPYEKPRRSLSRSKDTGGYTSSFDYDGITVYIKALSKEDIAQLKVKDAETAKRARDIQTKINATEDAEEKGELGMELADIQESSQLPIIKRTVRGWEGADVPFSPEALDDLPVEVISDWVPIILQRSVMGKTDAELLKNSLGGSQKANR